jgi:hypothetical protein
MTPLPLSLVSRGLPESGKRFSDLEHSADPHALQTPWAGISVSGKESLIPTGTRRGVIGTYVYDSLGSFRLVADTHDRHKTDGGWLVDDRCGK